ncbi:MAG: hypothetical protein IT162_14200 [Bryobacterales bacterium]|nr:hypothetical protein [Bryobacterales bacterium]
MKPLRQFGHLLAIAWAAFWIVSGAHSGFEQDGTWMTAFRYALFPGGLFAAIAAAVWRWEQVGAWAIILCGLAIAGSQSGAEATPVLLLAGPPLLGGLLLLLYRWRAHPLT